MQPPFLAWSRSQTSLVGARVGSGTLDFRSWTVQETAKNVAAPQHYQNHRIIFSDHSKKMFGLVLGWTEEHNQDKNI